jgi:hypothetical protein
MVEARVPAVAEARALMMAAVVAEAKAQMAAAAVAGTRVLVAAAAAVVVETRALMAKAKRQGRSRRRETKSRVPGSRGFHKNSSAAFHISYIFLMGLAMM